MTIPKILHFTWKTEDVPGVMARYYASFRELHPDWDIILWTDATMREFVSTNYPDLLAVYDGYPRNIQRADSFRYLVLNIMGGVYSDLDVEPFRAIDDLIAGQTCIAGIEPDENMGSDRWHCGAPFLVTNAFMGGVPGHPWFKKLVELLPKTASTRDIFSSTGPSVTTGAALRLPRAERPALVLPEQWFAEGEGGRVMTSDARLRDMLGEAFDFVEADGRYVIHRCITTWEPWYRRYGWLARPTHMMNRGKWALRRLIHRDLAAIDIPDALTPYFDQYPKPPEDLPSIAVKIVCTGDTTPSDSLVAALVGLDYPGEKLSLQVLCAAHEGRTCVDTLLAAVRAHHLTWRVLTSPSDLEPLRDAGLARLTDSHKRMARWAHLANAAEADADFVLFVDAAVTAIPTNALTEMVAAQKPVVALGAETGDGETADASIFRYTWGGRFRVVYKSRGEDGIADAAKGQRSFVRDTRCFAQMPLDGTGHSFVLVRRDVLEAGVRFAETPYHLHLGGEGFALMARHKGFEVAGLTELAVEKPR